MQALLKGGVSSGRKTTELRPQLTPPELWEGCHLRRRRCNRGSDGERHSPATVDPATGYTPPGKPKNQIDGRTGGAARPGLELLT